MKTLVLAAALSLVAPAHCHLQKRRRRQEACRCGAQELHDEVRNPTPRNPAMADSADKKLAGAAKASHMKKCVGDAVGT